MNKIAKARGVDLSIVYLIAYSLEAIVFSIFMFFAFSCDTLTKYFALWSMRLNIFFDYTLIVIQFITQLNIAFYLIVLLIYQTNHIIEI